MTNMSMKGIFIPNFVRFSWILVSFYHLWRGSYVSFSCSISLFYSLVEKYILQMTILRINWPFTSILTSITDFLFQHPFTVSLACFPTWEAEKQKTTFSRFLWRYVSEDDLDSANWYICASLYFHKNIMCEERQREILPFFWLRLWWRELWVGDRSV